jgi:hypothetical protein
MFFSFRQRIALLFCHLGNYDIRLSVVDKSDYHLELIRLKDEIILVSGIPLNSLEAGCMGRLKG